MNRREFFHRTAAAALLPLALDKFFPSSLLAGTLDMDDADALICKKKFEFAVNQNLAGRPINEIIVEIGKTFLGTDYVGHVLEQPGDERLVVNMRALDCVSFYENSLVLARCIKMKKFTFDDYKVQLQFIRYRGGIIDGYPSRLHYTTDYWFDNEKKGVIKVVTKKLFGDENVKLIPKPINFMTTHRSTYTQLANDRFFEMVVKQEEAINNRETFFLPKGSVHLFADKIKTGSLLGIATNIPGMDIAHTGVAIRLENGELHFMHAPNVGYKVQITEAPLHDYLAKNSKQTGIVVAEPLEPAA
ncbi:MAG: DUF1460 domain-containing protein [Ignavibacteriales bacterium]|nr:DUF1460 domain-containing protein [Ignavibacteriales bacterium]